MFITSWKSSNIGHGSFHYKYAKQPILIEDCDFNKKKTLMKKIVSIVISNVTSTLTDKIP